MALHSRVLGGVAGALYGKGQQGLACQNHPSTSKGYVIHFQVEGQVSCSPSQVLNFSFSPWQVLTPEESRALSKENPMVHEFEEECRKRKRDPQVGF